MTRRKWAFVFALGWTFILVGYVFGAGEYRFFGIAAKSWEFGRDELGREMRAWIAFTVAGLACLLPYYMFKD